MTTIEREGDGFVVDAAILSAAFDRPEPEIRASMADGRMTTRCEAGSGEDAGRWRLTFFHAGRAFRLTVNAEGQVLKRAIFDVPPNPFSIP